MTTKNSYGIYVGHSPESVKAVSSSILEILKLPYVDNSTKKKALKALEKSLGPIQNLNFSDLNITTK